jgi:hypothetical protein
MEIRNAEQVASTPSHAARFVNLDERFARRGADNHRHLWKFLRNGKRALSLSLSLDTCITWELTSGCRYKLLHICETIVPARALGVAVQQLCNL